MRTLLGRLTVIAIATIILFGAVVLKAYADEKPFAVCPLEKWTSWTQEEKNEAMMLVAEKFAEQNPNCERVYVEVRGNCCDVFFYAVCEEVKDKKIGI